ncbi:Sm-like ribonucleoprotein [Neoconidiobolus thromboides FSU 785]|nr:Sm-like ribonucleoprotein [Neoconidiobolus thromboides FSU 785]
MNQGQGHNNATKVQKVMVQPITLIFKHFQSRAKVRVWLFDHKQHYIEGQILGFDEFMNLVIENAEEVKKVKQSEEDKEVKFNRTKLGRLLLKGDNISLIQSVTDKN